MLDAARIAGLNPLRAMNDTTATALQYGIYRNKELPEKEEEAIKVLFVDVGYADTTATVVSGIDLFRSNEMFFHCYYYFNVIMLIH